MERHGLPKKTSSSRTRSQSVALQQCHELLQEMDIRKADTDGLEVVGSKESSSNPPAEHGDVRTDAPVPALRFCGQLAKWTGNSTDYQGEVGINSCIYFEALPGGIASSCLELHNEGNTAVFYSWQKLDGSSSISHLLPRRSMCFYFNQSSAVILPGDTQQIDLVFKSVTPGLHTESWQLKTHPRLLQGASVQVTLMGLTLYQDKTAELRRHFEAGEDSDGKLLQIALYKILEDMQTSEQPRSLAEFLMESPPSERCEEKESETMDLVEQILLFESLNEQI